MSGTPAPDDQTKPYQQPVETVIASLGTDAQHGLSEAEAQARPGRHGRNELATEEVELAAIYVKRGLEPALVHTVAQKLMAHDALGAHARDELRLSESQGVRPLQAALASAGTFSVGAALPILSVLLAPRSGLTIIVSGVSLICLAVLGSVAARTGGAPAWKGAVRVGFWGALAMAATAGVGALFGIAVS